MARRVNETRLWCFLHAYQRALRGALVVYPADYQVPVREHADDYVRTNAARLERDLRRGAYNYTGRAMRATCRVLEIETARHAIEQYLTTTTEGS